MLGQINQIDQQLGQKVEAYDSARYKLGQIERDQQVNRHDLGVARGNLKIAQKALAARLVSLDTVDHQDTTLDVLLGAKSLDDLLSNLDTVNRVSDQEEAARLRLFEGVRATLDRAARRGPVMLVLDDLHWADSSTVLLLAHLVRAKISGAVTIVGAYRPAELGSDQPLLGTLAELARERDVPTVELGGLDRASTASIIEGLIEVEPDQSLVEHVRQQTLGNAFFVEQLAGHLRDTGALTARDGRAVLQAPAVGAPSGVRSLSAAACTALVTLRARRSSLPRCWVPSSRSPCCGAPGRSTRHGCWKRSRPPNPRG